jgi:peptide/nickel transport system substrate-binding protein
VTQSRPLRNLYDGLTAGHISRRTFLERALALGVGAPVALFLARTGGVAAQAATPVPATGGGVAPSSGTEGQTRGAGGQLKLLQWQAPTTLNMQLAGSFKDQLASCLVTEPLIHFLPDGTPIPCLVKEVPSQENGLVSADLKTVTYNLLDGVVWSDGQPFTAKDVVYTWKWVTDPANQSGNSGLYGAIANVEAVDDVTVRITFKDPQLGWYSYFSSAQAGGILPEHVLSAGTGAATAFAAKPIGTGPYVVDSFAQNDSVQYSINQNYREPNKPYFSTVYLKGGGDAPSAARAVLQTGDFDFAWNLQVAPNILKPMAEGGKGDLVVIPGTAVEFIALNFSDPNKEVDGQKSQWQTPNPVLSDKAVRKALAAGVNRQAISENLYFGPPGEPPTSNILLGIAGATSPNTTWEFDLDKGNAMLDEAGWAKNGDVREKDGVPFKISYATTSQNSVRQQTQAVVKSDWEKLGAQVSLLEIPADVFFDTSAGNDQTFYHMYWDVHEYAWSPAGPYPLSYMLRWVSHNGENIPQKENGWSQVDEERYNNPDYDALYDQAARETDPQKAADLFIQMNDILIDDVVVIPLVQRASEKYAIAKRLNHDNVAGGPFESLYWNIANWNESGGA